MRLQNYNFFDYKRIKKQKFFSPTLFFPLPTEILFSPIPYI